MFKTVLHHIGEYQTSDGMEVAIQTLYALDHFKQRE